jgi:hypothetical protein
VADEPKFSDTSTEAVQARITADEVTLALAERVGASAEPAAAK